MIPLFFLHKRKEAAVCWWREGRRTQMGRTTSKKMIPLLLLRILWIHADKDHMISMEYICDRLEDEFESERRMGRPALRKLVSSNIRQLNLFFHETQWCLNEGEELQICEKAIANPEQPGGYIKVYCLNDRLFSDTEIRMLHDSILFSPGVDDGCASRILDKLKRCAGKYFGSWFEYVKYRETFKRCQCERLFQYLMEIGKAIKKIRKITFRYRKNGKLSDRVYTVTPYFLVISGGWYYLICNTDGKDNLSHYRIDRMLQVVMHPMEQGKCMSQLEGIDSSFEILRYMEEHPRMSYEKPVSATLMVEEYLVEAVETEFRTTSKIKTQEHLFRIRIISTKTAICNWIINLSEHIKIETTSDPSIIDQLCQKAQCIIENYQKINKIT